MSDDSGQRRFLSVYRYRAIMFPFTVVGGRSGRTVRSGPFRVLGRQLIE